MFGGRLKKFVGQFLKFLLNSHSSSFGFKVTVMLIIFARNKNLKIVYFSGAQKSSQMFSLTTAQYCLPPHLNTALLHIRNWNTCFGFVKTLLNMFLLKTTRTK